MFGTKKLPKIMVEIIVKEIMSESDDPELFSYENFWQSVRWKIAPLRNKLFENNSTYNFDDENYSMFDATQLMFELIELIVEHRDHFAEKEQKQAVKKLAGVFSFDLSKGYYGRVLKKRVVGKSLGEILKGSRKEIIVSILAEIEVNEMLNQARKNATAQQCRDDGFHEPKSGFNTGSSSHERSRQPYGSTPNQQYQQNEKGKGKEKAGSSNHSGFWRESSSQQQEQDSGSSRHHEYEQKTPQSEKQETSEQSNDPKFQNYSSMDMTEEQAYKILNAPKGTSIKKVKRLRDAFSFIYHTDPSENAGNENNTLAMQNINNAYELLRKIAELESVQKSPRP